MYIYVCACTCSAANVVGPKGEQSGPGVGIGVGASYQTYHLANHMVCCALLQQAVFEQSGIVHQMTMAESPQSNGVAERMNRTLWNQVRTMLSTAALPAPWWAEAVMTAAYIHNRLVHTTTNGKTPMELWNGIKPDVSHMRVFGCVAYTHMPHCIRTKSGEQSIKCLFIGYSASSKGYRLYDIEQRRMIESRDVIFNEH